MRPETERWLRYADEDLETVRVTLAGQRWAAASFYAQQAAEKALKAMFMEQMGTEHPRFMTSCGSRGNCGWRKAGYWN